MLGAAREQSYRVDLHPLDGQEWNASYTLDRGAMKDFVLVGSGLCAGEQHNQRGTLNIGGAITVEDYTFSLAQGTFAEVTLTPMDPPLDGTPGRAITRSGAIVLTVTGIRLAQYAVSARISRRPVDFDLRPASGGPNVAGGPLVFLANDAGSKTGGRHFTLCRVGPVRREEHLGAGCIWLKQE